MDVVPRPSLEPLPDLPLEEPLLDTAGTPKEPPVAPASSPTAAKDPEQTGLNFVDPELFLPADAAEASAPPPAPTPPSPPTPELTLEDPIVDELLIATPLPRPAPPPRASSAPAARASEPAERTAPKSAAGEERLQARVPIAKTAALSSAAAKVAAASAARERSVPKTAPPVAAIPTVRAVAPDPRAATKDGAASARRPDASRAAAPSLASWANARAAAAAPPKTPPGNAPRGAPTATSPPAMPQKSAAPRPAATAASPVATPAQAPGSGTTPPMDRDFIARNQVVERYLSGRLPLKGATDFERFCHDNPQLLDEIGLPERVNAGLRLLEAAGKPEPWQESPRPGWQKPQVTLALGAATVVFAIALALVGGGSASKSHRISALEKQAFERALDPATSTRQIRLLPSRSGATNSPAITIGGASAQLADFKIDETRSPYHTFRVTIDRVDQGRVGVITNLTKDSNGHLRIALNSSALGPGNYQLTIEGLDWRGQPQPDSWVTIGVLR